MRYIIIILNLFCFIFIAPMAIHAHSNIPYSKLTEQWQQQLDKASGTYGIYLLDINSGKTAGVNELTPFHAASTIKIPINLYLYQQMAAKKLAPSTLLTYKAQHQEGGTGYLQNQPIGSMFTIEELSQASITHSDNVATNILYDYLGRQNVKGYMRQIGGVIVVNNQNITCPRDMAIYMDETRKFTLNHPQLGSILMNHLEHTIFRDRLPAGIPPEITVANKTGDWPPTGTHNDVAYVKHPHNPYILVVLSKSTPSSDEAYQVIKNISRMTYKFQSSIK
ncbi:serine hydrolase [Peptococcaceae bacterium 1198_IL3148]